MTKPHDAKLGSVALLLLFAVTRIITVLLWLDPNANFVANDISYYGYHLHRLSEGATDVMTEYPPPAVWILNALYLLGGGWQTWMPVYATAMLLLDGAVAVSLYRRGRATASLFWILFTGANGAIVWFRFDLIPGALVAWACIFLASRPRLAGALVAVGASIKLWPALLIAPMAAPSPIRGEGRRRVLAFAGTGAAIALLSVAVEGLERNLGPLRWQSERGLQIESVPATVIQFWRTFLDAPLWHVELSEYNALELFGPGVSQTLAVASALTVATVLVAVWLGARLVRREAGPDPILLAITAILLLTVVTSKTLSPQYVVWLGGPVAALLLQPLAPRMRRHVVVQAVSLVVIAGLTQYTYPWGAAGIMALPHGSAPQMSVLILRNLGLVALTVHALWLSIAASRVPSRTSSS